MMHRINNEEQRANVVSNYQNHFRLSLQAVWNWTDCFLLNKEQMSNLFLLKTFLCELSIHLPNLEQSPLPSHLTRLSILQAFKTAPSNVWLALFVCTYLFCCLWPEPSRLRLCRQLEILKVKKKHNRSISPTEPPQLIILYLL